jgi:hypothetical protein
MRPRFALAALALSLAVGACDSDAPTSGNTGQQAPPEFKKESKLLKNLRATGTTVADVGGATGVFSGKVTVTRFDYDEATKTLLVSGEIKDDAGTVKQTFTRIPSTLTSQGAPTAPVCSILDLDIGAIHLDLLGLVVDLAPIHLDITAESGAGNLLGNLLCALAGLLDPPGPLAQILALLEQINAILAGL